MKEKIKPPLIIVKDIDVNINWFVGVSILQLSEIIVIFAIVSTHNLRKYANRVICIWNTLFLLSE